MQIRELQHIDDIPAGDWNALSGTECPFLRHEFLAALEHSGCVGGDSGWTPAHLALSDNGRLIAAAPAYRKWHSWGEFVFDFGWAQAHERHGLPYYPKLLVAVPFSPINAPRLLLAPDLPAGALREQMAGALAQHCTAEQLSSAHALFVTEQELQAFTARGWLSRSDVQFHWHNRGYTSFEQYPGLVPLGQAQADPARAAPHHRRRHQLPDPAWFGHLAGTAALRLRGTCPQLPAARPRALPELRLLSRNLPRSWATR